jgi:nucleoside-diphosphate-sugar epimerase
MSGIILVTGVSGNVGAEVYKRLQAEGGAVRAADLHVAKIRERFGSDVAAIPFDFSNSIRLPSNIPTN